MAALVDSFESPTLVPRLVKVSKVGHSRLNFIASKRLPKLSLICENCVSGFLYSCFLFFFSKLLAYNLVLLTLQLFWTRVASF